MRTVDGWSYQDGRVILEDADGQVVQFVEAGEFDYRGKMKEDGEPGDMQHFTRLAGWWDMRMTAPVHPSRIVFPATVVWEPSRRANPTPNAHTGAVV